MSSEGRPLRFGIAGTGMIARAHIEALRNVSGVGVVAVASQSEERAREFALEMGVANSFAPYETLFESPDVDAVFVCAENHLHASSALAAARAGKHIVMEKPLCFTLEEASDMIDAAREAGVMLGYAENLCFAPKFTRAREISEAGALGAPYMVRATLKHSGPYSDWFYDPERAGGGAMMDLGCHCIELCRWAIGKKATRSVYAQIDSVNPSKGPGRMEDHACVTIEFEGGVIGLTEVSWVLPGGTDCTLEIYGTEGRLRADLMQGSGLRVYSEHGYWPMGSESRGWTAPGFAHDFNYGYSDQASHFVSCVRDDTAPLESGEDGLAVLEIMLAAFASSREGKKIELPFRPSGYEKPIDLWTGDVHQRN